MSRSGVAVLSVISLFGATFWGCVARGPVLADDNPPAGRKLALLVGVKAYDHEDLKNLDFPENDVEELASVLKSQNYEMVVLTTARGKQDEKSKPTAKNIRTCLKTLLRGATKRDLIIVGLAGHGIQPLGSDDSYFCPLDANPVIKNDRPIEPERLVSVGEILGQMTNSGIGDKLLLVDACRNDPSVRSAKHRGVDHVNVAALPSRTGVLLSCSPGEFSFEEKSLGKGHGVFFYHVIAGLNGAARDGRGNITWDSLAAYVRTEVPPTVQKLFGKDGGEQSPNAIGNLRGVPTVLAIARIGTRPEPKPAPSDSFAGTRAGQLRDAGVLKLVWIPRGDFTMGIPTNERDRFDDGRENQVQVTLTKGFWLGQHEVTQSEWQSVMQTTPWSGKKYVKEGDDYPATFVSWEDGMKFCEKLTGHERRADRIPSGWRYTLPTEAQWEHACRGGTRSRFSFGDLESDLGEYAWFNKNAGGTYGHQVAQKKANPWGLYDMHGNVFEWCRDYYAKELPGGTDPEVSVAGLKLLRVVRGGSWGSPARSCRSAYRGQDASFRSGGFGFRVALTPPAK